MPYLSLYADEHDIAAIVLRLNAEPDVAVIVPNGDGCWRAVERILRLADGLHVIWCTSGGPLVAAVEDGFHEVENAWAGWRDARQGADARVPYFGAAATNVIYFGVQTRGTADHVIGMSSFSWIGNHYRMIGQGAPPAVALCWQRLRRAAIRSAVRVTPGGPLDGPEPDVWALPSAYEKLKAGAQRNYTSFSGPRSTRYL